MNGSNVIDISERPFKPVHNRKERIEMDARSIVPYMRELHEICAAAGKPDLLCFFFDSLQDIALAWRCDDKEKAEATGRRTGRGKRGGSK